VLSAALSRAILGRCFACEFFEGPVEL
jgi:hypothetical protein